MDALKNCGLQSIHTEMQGTLYAAFYALTILMFIGTTILQRLW